MSFLSVWYILFLIAAVFIFYLLPSRLRNLWLLIVSYAFYLSGSMRFSGFILFVTIVAWLAGQLLEKHETKRKLILTISLILCFSPLISSKYLGLFAELLALFGPRINLGKILVPLGISFYTLQAAGYIIDVYRENIKSEKSILNFALFIAFFPLVVSGPIERAKNILSQLRQKHELHYENLKTGMFSMLWGFFIKMVVADRLAILANSVYDNSDQWSGIVYILAILAFSLQIYCDFSAYSLIAIGSARLFGIEVMDNFQTPYLSQSVREFWRRWHISLSTWFRDYLYFPLGGSHCSKARKYLNILIVFSLSGLWHGASLSFLVWGALNGLFQVIEDALTPLFNKCKTSLHNQQSFFVRWVKTGITFALITFAWIFFRSNDLPQALHLIRGSFELNWWQLTDGTLLKLGLDHADWTVMGVGLLMLFMIDLKLQKASFASKLMRQPIAAHILTFIFLLVSILLFGVYGPAYDAQNFIYVQF